jgi:hypothetical protein
MTNFLLGNGRNQPIGPSDITLVSALCPWTWHKAAGAREIRDGTGIQAVKILLVFLIKLKVPAGVGDTGTTSTFATDAL